MGCGSSSDTAVIPLAREEPKRDEDETGSKLGTRGDSAVSKGTTDSGVVMENKAIPELPGAMPRKLPPLTSERVGESVADRMTQEGLLQHDGTVQERQKSSDILEELLSQGIILVGQSRERGSVAGEAYSIMLDDRDVVRQRPGRLESLKTIKEQSPPCREELDEKMRLVEERRKSKEDELKMRLRTKSARVRVLAPVSSAAEYEDTSLTPVTPLTFDLTPNPMLHSQITSRTAEGGECVREAGGDGRENETDRGENSTERERSGDDRGEGAEQASEDSDDDDDDEEEEFNQMKELLAGQLLTASRELESDSTFQHVEDKEEKF
ncbi:stathmin domain-containing protein 1 isoform X2 [Platichthys flesus]|uniref:stathmin domain-containing protein 1 isoform X2 n=1 Tax=Platichthys flesus TaxID=8260 RepID=UPI002DBE2557|nr:stathmin domain-containing protein 1 isoform X2 [Platichthys flesus]